MSRVQPNSSLSVVSIFLDGDDDLASIRDRLECAREKRILLILPPDGDLLTEQLEQALLRRHAERLGKEVGLVSLDPLVARHCRAVGLAHFRTLQTAQGPLGWRGWRRAWGKPPPGLAGHRPAGLMDDGDWRAMYRRMTALPTWRAWLTRYTSLFFFFSIISLLAVAAIYVLPGATITFHPLTKLVHVSVPVTTEGADEGGSRRPTVIVQWRATAPATGILEIPDAPARGRVVFANVLGQRVTVPAGTRVLASGGRSVAYQTLEDITVPNGLGATAEAEVIAVEPGTQGNAPPNVVNRIAGPLSLQLAVRNLEPIEGGAARQVAAVTEEDRERLRAHVLQYLFAMASQELQRRLAGNELLVENSLSLRQVEYESFSHFAGEQSQSLTLEMRASLEGVVLDPSQANGLVYEALAAAVDEGFAIMPASLEIGLAGIDQVDDSGQVHFTMVGEAMTFARLDVVPAAEAIRGHNLAEAREHLYNRLPLARRPVIEVQPRWFERVPYLPARIAITTNYEP